MFVMMAEVFAEGSEALSDGYVDGLLASDLFWAIAAFDGADVVGGLTAHTLPMTRTPSSEVFIYDLAGREDRQRQGIATRLVGELRAAAALKGIHEVFVPADNDDECALEFYMAHGPWRCRFARHVLYFYPLVSPRTPDFRLTPDIPRCISCSIVGSGPVRRVLWLLRWRRRRPPDSH